MWNPFAPRRPIPAEEVEWQFATCAWLRRVSDDLFTGDRPLITPTLALFPSSKATGHARAVELFDQVRAAAGLSDWPCRLEQGRGSRPQQLGAGQLLRHEGAQSPAGTFRVTGGVFEQNEVIITYNPELVGDPTALVATLAHELAHYRLATMPSLPPGGVELLELATDFTAVGMGFGLFLLNSAKSFSQFQTFESQGWQIRRQGYLGERALAMALAIQLRLSTSDPAPALGYLKPYLQSDLKRSLKYLDRTHPDLAMAIDGFDPDAFR